VLGWALLLLASRLNFRRANKSRSFDQPLGGKPPAAATFLGLLRQVPGQSGRGVLSNVQCDLVKAGEGPESKILLVDLMDS
jgi:hypothetical protein